MRYLPLIAVITILLASACAPDPGFEAVIETIGGVEWIRNPAEPKYPERSLTLEEELVIDGRDASGNTLLFQPTGFLVDADDDILIFDHEDQQVKVFDRDGVYLRSFGGFGQGPGEFQNVIDLDSLPDGRIIFLDTAVRRTSVFGPGCIFQRSHPWRGFHMDILLAGADYYIVDETVFMQPPRFMVKKIGLDGDEILSFGEFTPPGIRMVREGETVYSITVPDLPSSKFASDPQRERLYHCLNERFLIEVYDSQGRLFRRIERPYTAVPFTREDAERFYASHDRNQDKIYGKLARQVDLPRVKTVTDYMLVDDVGNLWVRTQETSEQDGRELTAYDIFDADGIYTSRVWLGSVPALLIRGKMYARITDEEGYRVIKRLRMTWSD